MRSSKQAAIFHALGEGIFFEFQVPSSCKVRIKGNWFPV